MSEKRPVGPVKDFFLFLGRVASYFLGIFIVTLPCVIVRDEDIKRLGVGVVFALAAIFGPVFFMWWSWHWKMLKPHLPKTRGEWIEMLIQGAMIGAIPMIVRMIHRG